ncbi:F-box/LRR-repeat protein 4-like [Salvia miltiorrhiza]|uniref:F-box/LRR-repeat protein 4-like n=1 Tax=Salvia miltiorrhiza TaxID=226208 RepID=UPI0025AC02E7|nr:F-box/LRR-repeat protein 4-like [Salvia miltiorrhiza]XP_057771397.1 F-box/LRR-repeat protein 4-like [Salvia miltiorrhiza]XP_057771398.1 F-box/LRR-repeat protein 4-like [Salvia miltiorrhiza]XP_057771400.1 F-box/LRR-repeat protein 4-like [Salvia miltiorrhiza]XP_057771401.1 F-box/LRR-repeat protein 4-like [Salvia miltiorrhiza]
MDTHLCDELLEEIFRRLPPPSSAAVSLVSKRWRRLLHSSTTSLSLNFPPPYNPTTITSLSTFLSHHPYLSSISLSGGGDPLLLAVADSCPNLRQLRHPSDPVSPFALYTLSASCVHLSSISVSLSRPLSFHWLPSFGSLKSLSLSFTGTSTEADNLEIEENRDAFDLELDLESLSLRGILAGDSGLSCLWRNCKNVKKLQLKSCESVGDSASFSNFLKFLNGIQELELRTCRSIVDSVLLKLAADCISLQSLLVYDGGSKEGLLRFINQSKCSLKKLDLRLPLDLDNSHLIALSENPNFKNLKTLRLESCCLVSGEGLKAVARAIGDAVEELALINCDVVEREAGLLAALGQELGKLRRLDLSHNEMMADKDLVSMVVSCDGLEEVRLRGCGRLSDAAVVAMVRSCRNLGGVDVSCCGGIGGEGVEALVVEAAAALRRVAVEESKVTGLAKMVAPKKCIHFVSSSIGFSSNFL